MVMSRVGKQPITIPAKVTVTCAGGTITVKGPLGLLTRPLHARITVTVEDGQVVVKRQNNDRESRSLHGLYRALIANMVHGVVSGYEKTLDLVGVGYRAEIKGSDLQLQLGYSHPISFLIPEGITMKVEKQTRVIVAGSDKEVVGEIAARIRRLRLPEPYKGKGVRYADEVIRKKAGKAAGAGAK
jgi:large subunit ribosomal protein L6